jgi:hypothetical protein
MNGNHTLMLEILLFVDGVTLLQFIMVIISLFLVEEMTMGIGTLGITLISVTTSLVFFLF